jgi:exonuclease SbcD
MKIAITADLHLTTRDRHPERYAALEDILEQMHRLQIDRLIIAGDLFDAQYNNFSDFENLCRSDEIKDIEMIVIPGNHDPNINQSMIAAENVRILAEPEIVCFGEDCPKFLFIPYREGCTLGDMITSAIQPQDDGKWILVGHGDWMGNVRAPNPYEKGVYMPLSQRDLEAANPRQVFLGHIHAAYDGPRVFYPGSPCGMDITETGRRRFLTYDTVANAVNVHTVNTQVLFFSRTFTVYPVEDEAPILQKSLDDWMSAYNLTNEEKEKTRLRVKLNGYASDKSLLKKTIQETLSAYHWYEEPDVSEVSVASDPARDRISLMVKEQIDNLAMAKDPDGPDADQVLLAALQMVYGGLR